MFPNLDLPFMLFHKAGITKRMMEFIMENVIGGMTVNRLFDVIKTKYEVNHTMTSQFFANEVDAVRSHIASEGIFSFLFTIYFYSINRVSMVRSTFACMHVCACWFESWMGL